MTVTVTGDLRITDDITYPATYANRQAIPYIRFNATGNIYIGSGVEYLDAILVANGTIYTCHDAGWPVPIVDSATVNLGVNCNRPLVVNGALVANSIKLTRTSGQLRISTPTDGAYVGAGYVNAGNIGELIRFTPEIYLARPADTGVTGAEYFDYDSVTSLPPFF
jgi:hypothetical protein